MIGALRLIADVAAMSELPETMSLEHGDEWLRRPSPAARKILPMGKMEEDLAPHGK